MNMVKVTKKAMVKCVHSTAIHHRRAEWPRSGASIETSRRIRPETKVEEAGHDEHREDGKPHNGLVNGLVSSVLGNARSFPGGLSLGKSSNYMMDLPGHG